VVTLRLSPEPSAGKDLGELLSERVRGVIRERIIEDVKASVMHDLFVSRLPKGIKFLRGVGKYCIVITNLMNKPVELPPNITNPALASALCRRSPYFMLFAFPVVIGLSPELVFAYVNVTKTVIALSMTRAEAVAHVKDLFDAVFVSRLPTTENLREYLTEYNVTYDVWKKGFCLLMREFLDRYVRTAPIEDVIEVKNYVAYCLAEGLPYGCLLRALPRPLAYAIYHLVYLCGDLQFVVGTILSKEGAVVSTEKLKEEEKEWLQRALETTRLFRETGRV
jgi:hypothetical protein